MRTTLFWTAALTLGLLATIAAPAFAQGQPDGTDQAARRERAAELREARNASLAAFHENRTAAIQEYRAAHNATKNSFLENKTRVLGECAELRNSTEDKNATAKCVRDGLKPLIENARAEHKAQKETLLARLLDARTAAKEQFMQARDRPARPSSG